MDGDTIVVGAHLDDEGGTNSGSAYAFVTSGWAEIEGSGANTVDHTVIGLANGSEYTFGIRAVNDGGPGPASGSVTATPLFNSRAEFAGATAGRLVAENTVVGASIGAPVAAIDPEGDTLTYALSGTEAGSFNFDTTTG